MKITKQQLVQLVKETVNEANSDQAAALARQKQLNAKMGAHKSRAPRAPRPSHQRRRNSQASPDIWKIYKSS